MTEHVLEREQLVPRPLDEVFAFFAEARNLERITPPWLRFEVLTPEPIAMTAGTLIDYRLRLRGIPLRWVSRIEEWEHERAFADRQLRGPYRLWHHRHEFVRLRQRHGRPRPRPLRAAARAARRARARRVRAARPRAHLRLPPHGGEATAR